MRYRLLSWFLGLLPLSAVMWLNGRFGEKQPQTNGVMVVVKDGKVSEVYAVSCWGDAWDRLKTIEDDLNPTTDAAHMYKVVPRMGDYPFDTRMELVDDFGVAHRRWGMKPVELSSVPRNQV